MPKRPVTERKVKTRRAIIDLLKRDGAREAGVLAEALGVTGMAVRQHLYALQEERLVDFREESRGVGRPAKLWQLTEAADDLFPDTHAELAADLIAGIRTTFGAEGLSRLVEARRQQQLASYSEAMADCSTAAARLQRLAELRTAEGYMAAVETDASGALMLVERHCAICTAARSCLQLCAAEQATFAELMGPDHEVERVDHILSGAVRCAYRVTPVSAPPQAADLA
jgi:predicted ArsR family transcriptional regulator